MNFPYDDLNTNNVTGNLIKPLADVLQGQDNQNDSFVEKVLDSFGFNLGVQSGGVQVDNIFTFIQSIANYALGLLAFISVGIIIYNFFMIFFSKEKEGVENAQKSVKRVAYVLFIIGCSWLIVSFLFLVLSKIIH